MTMRDWPCATYGNHVLDFWSLVANADGTTSPETDTSPRVMNHAVLPPSLATFTT